MNQPTQPKNCYQWANTVPDHLLQRLPVPVADYNFGPPEFYQDNSGSTYCQVDPSNVETLDSVTWQTINSLRDQACSLINSEGEGDGEEREDESSSDSLRTPPYPCNVCLRDYSFLKVLQGLMDYEPESEFLKIIKEQFLAKNEQLRDIPPECRLKHFLPLMCHECVEQAEGSCEEPCPEDTRPVLEGLNARNFLSQPTDPRYFGNRSFPVTGRPTTSDNPRRRTWNAPLYAPSTGPVINDPQFYKINEGAEASLGSHPNYSPRSEHVSRSKEPVKCGGRRKRKTDGTCESQEYFEPNLKKPHERSCERCWRYASPARSPVNKPDQKYDPNFRKAHSCTEFTNVKDSSDLEHFEKHMSPCKNLHPLPPKVPSVPASNVTKDSQRSRHRSARNRKLSTNRTSKPTVSATPVPPIEKNSAKLSALNESPTVSPPVTFAYEAESNSKTKSNSPGSRMTSFFDFPDDLDSSEYRTIQTRAKSPPGSGNKSKQSNKTSPVPSTSYKVSAVQGPLKIHPTENPLKIVPPSLTKKSPQNNGAARNGSGRRSSPQSKSPLATSSPINRSTTQTRNAQNESSLKSTSPFVGSSMRDDSFLNNLSPIRQGSPRANETLRSDAAMKGSPARREDSMPPSPRTPKTRGKETLERPFDSTMYAEIAVPKPSKKSTSPRKSHATPKSSKGGRRSKSSAGKARTSRASRRLEFTAAQSNLPDGNPPRTQSLEGLQGRSHSIHPNKTQRSKTPDPRPTNLPPHPVNECRCSQNVPQGTFIRNSMPPGASPGSMPPGNFPPGNMSNLRPIYCCHCGSKRSTYDPNYDFTFRLASDFGQSGIFDYGNHPSYGFNGTNPILNLKYNPNESESFYLPCISDVSDSQNYGRQEGVVNCPYRAPCPPARAQEPPTLRNQTYTIPRNPNQSINTQTYTIQPNPNQSINTQTYTIQPNPNQSINTQTYTIQPNPNQSINTQTYTIQPNPNQSINTQTYTIQPSTNLNQNINAQPCTMPPNPNQTLDNSASFQPLANSTPMNPNFCPRKYCVFYMTKSKEENGKEVEVLVEELTQKCTKQDSKSKDKLDKEKDITDKMKKVQECPSESMALRFQKGVSETCKSTPSSRLLYF